MASAEKAVDKAVKVVSENIEATLEVAISVLSGYVLYRLASPYLDKFLGAVPAQFRAGAVGVATVVAGAFMGVPFIVGLGSGAIMYNLSELAMPLAMTAGDKLVSLVPTSG